MPKHFEDNFNRPSWCHNLPTLTLILDSYSKTSFYSSGKPNPSCYVSLLSENLSISSWGVQVEHHNQILTSCKPGLWNVKFLKFHHSNWSTRERIARVGRLTLADCQTPTLGRTGEENRMRKLVHHGKDRETTYQLLSWAKQTQLGEKLI